MDSDRVLPVFPLEGVILFPRTMLPLHIFEKRYRQMVTDLLNQPEEERFLVIANMSNEGLPSGKNPFAKVATIGRLVHHEALNDGRSNIVLYGQFTVEIEEIVPSNEPYRTGKIVEIREEFWSDPMDDHENERANLLASIYNFMERTNLTIENLEEVSLDDLINGLAFSLNLEDDEKQELLEIQEVDNRLKRLIEILDDIGFYANFVPEEDDFTGIN
ncbi:MAG: LON peptidase substrate-binding domain-containing protein [Candidatus Kariarchaeaceae archaeon]